MSENPPVATTPQYRAQVRAHEHAVDVIAEGLRQAGWEASVYDTVRAVLAVLFACPDVLRELAESVDPSAGEGAPAEPSRADDRPTDEEFDQFRAAIAEGRSCRCCRDAPFDTTPDIDDREELVDVLDTHMRLDDRGDAERVADALIGHPHLLHRLSFRRAAGVGTAVDDPHNGESCEGVEQHLDTVEGDLNEISYWLARHGANPRKADGTWDCIAAIQRLIGPERPSKPGTILAHDPGAGSGSTAKPDGKAADILRAAAHLIEQRAAATDSPVTVEGVDDAAWVALMRPAVAAPLAAWLRSEADSATAAQAYLDTHHDGVPPPGTWSTERRHRDALAVARALISETSRKEETT